MRVLRLRYAASFRISCKFQSAVGMTTLYLTVNAVDSLTSPNVTLVAGNLIGKIENAFTF